MAYFLFQLNSERQQARENCRAAVKLRIVKHFLGIITLSIDILGNKLRSWNIKKIWNFKKHSKAL